MKSKEKDSNDSIKKAFAVAKMKADTKAQLDRLELERKQLLADQSQAREQMELQSQMERVFGDRHRAPAKRDADKAELVNLQPQKKRKQKPEPPKRKPKPSIPKKKKKKSKQKDLFAFFKKA